MLIALGSMVTGGDWGGQRTGKGDPLYGKVFLLERLVKLLEESDRFSNRTSDK